MADASAEPFRYFILYENDDADDESGDSGQQGRSGAAGRMCLVEIRCHPARGQAADRRARWVLERTVVRIPSSDVSHVLGDAVDNYVAKKITDPAFTFSDTWWIVSDPGGLGAAAEAVNHAQDGLHQLLLDDPAQTICQALGSPMPRMVGDLAAELPLPIVDRPLGFIREVFEVGGMAVGLLAGMPLLATASCKAFLHDQVTSGAARTIGAATRALLTPPAGPPKASKTRTTHPAPTTRAKTWQQRRGVGGDHPRSPTSPDDVTQRAINRNPPARRQGRGTSRGPSAPFG
jgi:hypothetical protein